MGALKNKTLGGMLFWENHHRCSAVMWPDAQHSYCYSPETDFPRTAGAEVVYSSYTISMVAIIYGTMTRHAF